jgi:hypothetical protein
VLQIAKHLGIEISSSEATEIAAEYSFQTNRRRTLELVNRLKAQGVDLDNPSNLQYYDQRTLLHWNHLREGRPGNWREQATVPQRATLARLCDAWLIDHDYEADTIDPLTETQRPSEVLKREVELARAWASCALRCAALRYPATAGWIKRVLGIPSTPAAAVPATPPSQNQVRVDSAHTPTSPSSSDQVPVRAR